MVETTSLAVSEAQEDDRKEAPGREGLPTIRSRWFWCLGAEEKGQSLKINGLRIQVRLKDIWHESWGHS